MIYNYFVENLLLITIIFLTITQLTLGLGFMFVVAKVLGVDLTVNLPNLLARNKKLEVDKTIPLQDFKPDFTKPIKIRLQEEDKITPL